MVEVQVTIGRFTLRVGSPEGARAAPAAEPNPPPDELAEALRGEPSHVAAAADALGAVAGTADEATAAVERANDLVTAITKGLTLDPKALEQQVNALLNVLDRADRDGRFEDEIRLARALVALLALVPRWVALVEALRRAAAAAAAVGDRAGEAWAHHELGSFALGADDAHAASYHLNEALGIRESIGDEAGAEATRQNLRLLALVPAGEGGWRPGRTAVAIAAGVAALLLAGGLAIAAWRGGGDEPRVGENGLKEAEVTATTTDAEPTVTEAENEPPTAGSFTLEVEEDTPREWTPDVDDPDGDALACAIERDAENGAAEVEDDCTRGTYTPSAGFSGADAFVYRATDGERDAAATVAVRITPANDAPVAGDDEIQWVDDPIEPDPGFLRIAVSDLLANDVDEENDTLTVTSVEPDGNVSLLDPTVLYEFGDGPDAFTYTVSDGNGGEDTATVTLVPRPPSQDGVG